LNITTPRSLKLADILEHLTRLTNLEHFEIASMAILVQTHSYGGSQTHARFSHASRYVEKLTQLEAFNFFNSSNEISLS
jgi:hypothetical protein